MAVIERDIEKYLKRKVEEAGGICIKLSPDYNKGIPDRLCLLPGGKVFFVETKRPEGGRVGALQKWWSKQLEALGVADIVCRDKGDIDFWIDMIASK